MARVLANHSAGGRGSPENRWSEMSSRGHEGYRYDFCDPVHPAEMLDALRDFRAEGLFTDVTLLSDSGRVLLCHRMVLAARSPFFRAMFTADMREKRDKSVHLPGLDSEVLGAVIDFIYTSRITITQSNAFLIRLLDVDNCLGMQAFAELHMCRNLEVEARRTMLSRFKELVEQEEFVELSSERLITLLSLPNISMLKERTTLDAVMRWVCHDRQARLKHTQELMHCLHLNLDEDSSSSNFNMWDSFLFTDSASIRIMIAHMLKPSLNAARISSKKESYSVTQLGADVYVTGGYNTDTIEALDTVWVYNGDRDKWTLGVPMLWARYYHCSIALHGCVYAIGGYRGGAPTAETEFFDPLKKKWAPVAGMVFNKVGDPWFKGTCTYEKIQMYRSDLNEWSIATTCPHPEYGLSSVILNNCLYLVGGQTATVDCYDPERNEWREASEMKERRMECGAVVMNGCVYVSGGYSLSKGTYLETIEKYDPDTDSWEITGNLPIPARSHGCVCLYSV
uniref:Kelch like family member 23 n=1 Tax=Astyanax mexicanus TaxID=7994 RepID=A0A3B1IZZ9_ASTMX